MKALLSCHNHGTSSTSRIRGRRPGKRYNGYSLIPIRRGRIIDRPQVGSREEPNPARDNEDQWPNGMECKQPFEEFWSSHITLVSQSFSAPQWLILALSRAESAESADYSRLGGEIVVCGDGGINVRMRIPHAGSCDVVELEGLAGHPCSSGGFLHLGDEESGAQRFPYNHPSCGAEGGCEPREVQHQSAWHSSRGRHSLRRWKEGEGGAIELRQEGQGARQGGGKAGDREAAGEGGAAAVAVEGGEGWSAHDRRELGVLAEQDREPGAALQGRRAGRAVGCHQPQHPRCPSQPLLAPVAPGPRLRVLCARDVPPSRHPANPCRCHFCHRRLSCIRRIQFCFHLAKVGIELLLL